MIDSASDADFLQGGDEPDLGPVVKRVAERYPTLAPHLAQAAVQWGDPEEYKRTGGHLEFYPPWESENPNPGRPTIELYDRGMKGRALEDAIAGDMLHHLGSVDPEGRPIDPTWRIMRDMVIEGRSPEWVAKDEKAYADAVKNRGEHRSFDDWMAQSQADAYLRGYITPDLKNEWAKVYTPEQKEVLEIMKRYLGVKNEQQRGLINQGPR